MEEELINIGSVVLIPHRAAKGIIVLTKAFFSYLAMFYNLDLNR